MLYVSETVAGKSISAWVILKRGKHVATVKAHSGSSRVLVNVHNLGDDNHARTIKALGLSLDSDGKITTGLHKGEYAYKVAFQTGDASGYGYDKLTAALSGLVIDGHTLTDHCSRLGAPKPPKGRKTFARDAKAPKGYSFSNFVDGGKTWPDGTPRYGDVPANESGYVDCYRLAGLEYLKAIGYTVIQAI